VISGGGGGIRTHGLQEAAAKSFDDVLADKVKRVNANVID